MEGYDDPFNRGAFRWDLTGTEGTEPMETGAGEAGGPETESAGSFDGESAAGARILAWVRELSSIRGGSPALKFGELDFIYAWEDRLCFYRHFPDGKDAFGRKQKGHGAVVMINRSQNENWYCELDLTRFRVSVLKDKDGVEYRAAGNKINLPVPPMEYGIYYTEP